MISKTIVFDFGGVLVDWNPRYLYRKMFNQEAEMEWFLENICTSAWNLRIDCGKPFADSVQELSAAHPGWAREIAAFHYGWEQMLGGAIAASVKILEDLQTTGYKIYGLTNWSAETFPIAFERFKFLQTFDGIVVSGTEKLVKPDPAIFKVLLDRFKLEAENCLFIDDNLHNIAAADKLGFETIHFTDPPRLRLDLQQLGML